MTPSQHTPDEQPAGIGRRQLLVAGGATVSLAALLAACGDDGAPEPGRVGFAPAPTALPTETVNDAVHLRTAQSIEHTILEVYGRIAESGALTDRAAELLDRLIDEHRTTADEVGRLVTAADGEPYECANSWYMDRVIPPLFEAIEGDPDAGIAPSDDPARDSLALMNAMESMASSMYQALVARVTAADGRADVARLAARAARHSAAVAITATGAPEGYFSPAARGEETTPDESGLVPLHAVPGQFGSLSPYSLVLGAPSEAGTRSTFSIETPAENSFVYLSQTCEV